MATIKFTPKPMPVLTELRPMYKICQALLILHICGHGSKCSLVKLHLMHWAMKTPKRMETMTMAAQLGQISLPVWGFDPALSIALQLAVRDGLIEATTTGFKLLPKGRQLVTDIISDGSVMADEKITLSKIGRRITESMVKTISKEWE
ncbi:hypothetical protein CNQ84_13245 [Pseudomonas abyssi]|uniref:Uncharacterized protein n=1 Tax=Pseudomonas abyssi TaxID=170540 RepID=A0A2A3MGA3_9PSED|nr:hypothetical protein [Pseudomonas abyssi]MAD01906.1 hypothetical protein [Pseudomonadales bacterium]PBK03849.1 hypothetical protein CNQ84_13245 [Pseudomonas abyssi]|tara:strand:+ start:8781 stop:9224 length:444 start_codon:yes stop_codon:yes gene_type:complete